MASLFSSHKRMKLARVQTVGPFLTRIMDRIGCLGITMPWRVAYISASATDYRVVRHELVHLAQIRRDGDLRFWALYLYYCLVRGYDANPYEVEADRLAGTAVYRN
jgi:hypothetical protein